MGGGGLGKYCGRYGGDAGDGYFSCESGITENLGGCVEVADGVGCYDHDCLLWVTVGGVR